MATPHELVNEPALESIPTPGYRPCRGVEYRSGFQQFDPAVVPAVLLERQFARRCGLCPETVLAG